jgi:hypothetical protein
VCGDERIKFGKAAMGTHATADDIAVTVGLCAGELSEQRLTPVIRECFAKCSYSSS